MQKNWRKIEMADRKRGRPRKIPPGVNPEELPEKLDYVEKQRLLRIRREAAGKRQLAAWVDNDTMEWLKQQAQEREISVGDVINEVVKEKKKKGTH
uniref:Uncharacterized protein n=1 Tax=Leptospirillum ferrodiazotrophum TaxID=412449 RepID=C6HZK5_9BACT|nr:MAG: hypothetical protein UBAL3_95390003 [Leptospirillum ferrodiazotrophum]